MIKLLVISASPKKHGHTERLLDAFVKSSTKKGARVQTIRLYDHPLPNFSGKLTHRAASNTHKRLPRLHPTLKLMRECDGFLIATPTHWFNEPGALKDFIDHLTILEEDGYYLEGKVAGAIAYSPHGGGTDVLENLALVLTNMGCVLPPYSLIWFGQKEEQWTHRDIDLLAKNMILQIQAQRVQKISWDYE